MKLVTVGKGGSGKTTLAWLLASCVLDSQGKVLTIDGDHNMDLSHLFSVEVKEETPTVHRKQEEFFKYFDMMTEKNLRKHIAYGSRVKGFCIDPKDEYTKEILIDVSKMHKHIVVGLGTEDILYRNQCSHGMSAPMKAYIPLLDSKDFDVVLDGVAGVDMMNYGLYSGSDTLLIVVEPHVNSIRVAKQISILAEKMELPYMVVINKPKPGSHLEEINSFFKDKVVGQLPYDASIVSYNFTELSDQTKEAVGNIIEKVRAMIIKNPKDNFMRTKHLEQKKEGLLI
jgi:CO dehydrogenase maturation factor